MHATKGNEDDGKNKKENFECSNRSFELLSADEIATSDEKQVFINF
jgi:hypothetical protein